MSENNIKIKISNLHKSFGKNHVLNNINLDIISGTSLVIVGPSGTGKSVFIKTIIGTIIPDYGNIFIDGIETSNISDSKRFSIMQNMGFLFQGGALFDSLTVKDNIIFFAKKLYDLNHKDLLDLAKTKLTDVGLSHDVLHLYPSELSGGMQKRVSLARTIATNPQIIFFDEPTTGLDPIMTNVINELIIKAKNNLNATTITITHDMNSAYKIADYIAFFYKGNISWIGKKEDLHNSENELIKQFMSGNIDGPIKN
jgi:phospholipid/cholesterol/gamma-HCH transport system ATP-binding protein